MQTSEYWTQLTKDIHIDVQLGEHTQSAANCIPPAEVALNLAVGDFERNGEIGIGEGGGGVKNKLLNVLFENSVRNKAWR